MGLFALGAIATPANAVVITDNTNLDTVFTDGVISETGENAKGIDSTSENGYITTFTTPTINITATGTKGRGVDAWWGSNVTLGGDNTTSVRVEDTQRGLSIFDPNTVVNINSSDSVELIGGGAGATVSDRSRLNISAKDIIVTSSDGNGISANSAYDSNDNPIPNTGSKIKITTNDLTVTAKNFGVSSNYGKSQIDINATGDVNITATGNDDDARAIHVGNSSTDPDITKENTSYVSIKAQNINLTSNTDSKGIGVSAMSNGYVELEGNTTITAQDAILTRGNAVVNINEGHDEYTTVLNGDINFNYNDATSKTGVDAIVNVNLNGAGSSWTGNTLVSWDDVKPTATKLEVKNASVSLKNGATWNATKVTANAEAETNGGYYTALNNLNVDGGVINFQDADAQMQVQNLNIGSKGVTVTGGMMNISDIFDSRNGKIDADSAFSGISLTSDALKYVDANLGSATMDAITGGIN